MLFLLFLLVYILLDQRLGNFKSITSLESGPKDFKNLMISVAKNHCCFGKMPVSIKFWVAKIGESYVKAVCSMALLLCINISFVCSNVLVTICSRSQFFHPSTLLKSYGTFGKLISMHVNYYLFPCHNDKYARQIYLSKFSALKP